MLRIHYRSTFQKDVNRCKKRGLDTHKLTLIMRLLAEEQPLPINCRDHVLTGNFSGHRECHIQPDWLLIYRKMGDLLVFERTGTHSDLFKS